MPIARLFLFGGFRAETEDGVPVVLRNRKDQALLAYLALHAGRPVARDRLVGLLWADSDQSAARHSLRQSLSTLRKVVGAAPEERLVTGADTVTLAHGSLTVDVLSFRRAIARGDRAALSDALALYTGDLLDGFSAGEEAFDDWLDTERNALRHSAARAFAVLAEAHRQAADIDRAVDALLAVIRLDPMQERALREVMELLAETGRHLEALRAYQRFVETLEREMGVEAEPATKEAYLRILDSRVPASGGGAALGGLTASLVEAFRSLDAFVLYDADERFVMCNDRFREFFPDCRDILRPGTPLREIIRAGAVHGYYPASAGRLDDWVEERVRSHRMAAATSELLLADGRRIFLTQRRTEAGGSVVIFTDITDRRAAQADRQGGRYLRLLESLPVGVVEVGPDGTIRYGNGRFHHMLGYAPPALNGRKLSGILARAPRGRQPIVADDTPRTLSCRRRQGDTARLCVHWTAQHGHGGEVVGFVGLVTRDMRELRNLVA
ncbi:MAG TPA: PAS-domain containing protein [Alphaproteobacteria bacterium]